MKNLKIIFFLTCMTIAIVGCLDNNTGPEPVIDYGGISNFYIVNQSGLDLNVTYKIVFADIDSTIAAPADSTTKIFEDAQLGGSPPPSSAFAKLSFYKLSDDTTSPLLTIEPIVNESWDDVTIEADSVRKYELVITEENLE